MSACPPLKLGFVPLTDAGMLIVAAAKGFFAAEGLSVELVREVSWATIRDKLLVGALDGAHMLAPMAFATTLGAGSDAAPMVAPLALNLNGAAVTVSARIAPVAGGLAQLVRRRTEAGASQLTFAIVYPYSVHNYLLRAWLLDAGVDPDRDVRLTVAAPSRTADLLADGVIEGFSAGEPWNSVAEAAGVGRIVTRASAMLAGAPDKLFGMTERWALAHPDAVTRLLRALFRAADWIAAPANREAFVRLLAEPQYVGAPPALIANGLSDIVFPGAKAGAPAAAHGLWMIEQMVRWGQIARPADPQAVTAGIFRPDLHAAALAGFAA
jgi:NitT/TauT family transport system ATP-binding protein/nitrate/nitrite transport system substrate-binding protein